MKDDDIQQIFFVECDEALEAAETGLDACKAGTHDAETINAIFRGVHSIKGGAGAFGYAAMQAYTHCFENLLGDVREGAVALTSDLVDLLLGALDVLRGHVEAAREGGAPPDDKALKVRLETARAPTAPPAVAAPPPSVPSAPPMDFDLDALLDDLGAAAPAAAPESKSEGWLVHIRPHAGAMDNGGEPILWLRELAAMGGACVSCDAGSVPMIDELRVDEGYLGWTFRMPGSVTEAEVADIFDFAGEHCSIAFGERAAIPPVSIASTTPPAPSVPPEAGSGNAPSPPHDNGPKDQRSEERPAPDRRASAAGNSQSVRIDLGKLDRLIDAVGELVIAQSMLAQRLANANFAHIEELGLLETLVRDIQEHAMAFRAQPISAVFGRVPRLLRELAGNTGKHVKLQVSGETTELDKTVIERLSEPMTHLIRNAVDHGIEPPAERIAAGKEPEGTLSLSAE
jgi:two-component system, chemotaxis family, sensor kinase CheA